MYKTKKTELCALTNQNIFSCSDVITVTYEPFSFQRLFIFIYIVLMYVQRRPSIAIDMV